VSIRHLYRRCSFTGQANNLLCVFGKLDCSVKTKLLKSYCFSFYGCELWDLHNVNIDGLCKLWRQAVRRLWRLPYNCHVAILECLPLFDVYKNCTRTTSLGSGGSASLALLLGIGYQLTCSAVQTLMVLRKNSRLFCFNLLLINFSLRTFFCFNHVFSVRVLLAPLDNSV